MNISVAEQVRNDQRGTVDTQISKIVATANIVNSSLPQPKTDFKKQYQLTPINNPRAWGFTVGTCFDQKYCEIPMMLIEHQALQ